MPPSRRAAMVGAATLLVAVLATAVPAAAARPAHHKPILAATVSANLPSLVAKQPSAAAGTWLSGDFAGFSALADKEFGVWRGRPITSATDFLSNTSWAAFDSATRLVQTWKGQSTGIQLSIAVPLWAGYGYNHLATAASGYYDKHFVAMARSLVAAGLGHSVLRIGWEFNGSWFNWGITSTGKPGQYATRAREFASAWRHIVTAIRHVKGAHFKFDWCVAAGPHYTHLKLAYPGNSYVNYIGEDVYDWNRDNRPASAKARWDAIVNQGTGLAWLAKFAAAHHKKISVPEWALVHDAFDKWHSGGDDTSFVDHMHAWFASHNVAYENYFDSVDGDMSFSLNTGQQFPSAGKLYRALWSRPGGVRRLA
jgi:Glycosyl hydrolase family 26